MCYSELFWEEKKKNPYFDYIMIYDKMKCIRQWMKSDSVFGEA